MSIHILKNEEITLKIEDLGAELVSVSDNRNGTDYLWNGDPAYWKRHSPVLFPIVGSLKGQKYTYAGKDYILSQHGFARDMVFDLIDESSSEIWFRLTATEETKRSYPFDFTLEIGYRLEGRSITVLWTVQNNQDSAMFFSIGAHPAFMCPLKAQEKQEDYYIRFNNTNPIHYLLINQEGLAVKKPFEDQSVLHTQNGFLPVTADLFSRDALIIENHQYHSISLADPEKKPYVTVEFDAPLFGLWSPAGKGAPFICIEPWYGRCDCNDFNGSLEEREWGNTLEAGKQFDASYKIIIA